MSSRSPSLARIQLAAVIRKEVFHTLRDRRMMAMLVVAPLVQTIIFGYAVDFDVDRVPAAVVDLDKSPTSRALARGLLADGTLLRAMDATSAAEAEQAIDRGDVAVALIVPADTGRDLLAARPARLQLLLDGTDPNRATVATSAASRYVAQESEEILLAALQARGVTPPARAVMSSRVAYNPSLRSPPFMVPGVMAMLLLIVTTIVTAMGLSREREMGTLEQVLVTPIRPVYLLAGKMAPFVAVGFLDVLLVLAAGGWLFDLPMRGSMAVLFAGAVLYLAALLGVGLLISTLSRTQQQSFLGGFLFAMPAILLSGVMTPIRAMPPWLQAATYLNPVRYFIELLRAVLLKGAGAADVWPQLLALLLFGAVLLAVASARFRKRLV